MPDQPVTEIGPGGAGEEFHQILFHLHGIAVCRQSQPQGKSADMGIDDDPLVFSKCVAEHDIGRLAPHTMQGREFIHRLRNFAAVLRDDVCACRTNRLCLVAIEPGGLHRLFDFLLRGSREIARGFILFKQRRRDHVHPLVGALRGKNRRDEELQGIRKIELAMRIRVNLPELLCDGRRVFFAFHLS